MSLPSRERGLKYFCKIKKYFNTRVAPFAGAWIEIHNWNVIIFIVYVAPFAGAWIEIAGKTKDFATVMVAPFAGAWIEIF